MATINFDNKEAISQYPSIPEKNKVTDANINLIKQVGNQILTTLGVYTDDWDDTATYLIDDVVVYDNRFFKNLTGTNTSTPPTEDSTNWVEVSLREISGGAEIPIQNTAPANPREDDLWIDTSEPEGYNEPLDYYSTTEVKTNKIWIDGKPIYRVCKNIGYLPDNSRIVPTFENIIPQDVVITHLDAICHRYSNNVHDYRPLSDMVITFLYRPSLYALYVDTNENYSDWECIAILEYTK